MAPCTCASTRQRVHHAGRSRTRRPPGGPCTSPFTTETSATCAHTLPNDSCTAMPRARPVGEGAPQPAFSAASSSTSAARAACPRGAPRRYSSGSLPAASASSSIIVSMTNAVCELPTERHQSTGTPRSSVCSVHLHVRESRRASRPRPRPRWSRCRPSPSSARTACRAGSTGRRSRGSTRPACPGRRGPTSTRCTYSGPVVAAADVVLARPDHLDRHLRPPSTTSQASTTKSETGFARRPKPPPASIVWSFTFSGSRPEHLAAAALVHASGTACRPRSRAPSPCISTVQLSGSIGAWARYGTSYSATTVLRRALQRLGVAGLAGRRRPALFAASRERGDERGAWTAARSARGPTRPRARRGPVFAAQKFVPTTATPLRGLHHVRHARRGLHLVGVERTSTCAPKTGRRATTAARRSGPLHVEAEDARCP